MDAVYCTCTSVLVAGPAITYHLTLNKLTAFFNASVLLFIDHEFRHNIVKVAVDP